MGTDASRSVYRALLPHDTRISKDNQSASDTSITQLGAKPGVPTPLVDTEMVLQGQGQMLAAADVNILTQSAGMPELDGGGSFVWKNTTDSTTSYRGWDVPSVITGFESVAWDSTKTDTYKYPHVICLSNQTLLVVYSHLTSTQDKVSVSRSSTAGTWSTPITVYTAPSISGKDYYPCLVELPSGRILLFHWTFEEQNAAAYDLANVRMWYSDDDGVTWSLGQKRCLTDSIDTQSVSPGYIMKRLRAAYKDGQLILVAASQHRDTTQSCECPFWHYASDDLGSSFSLVRKWDQSGVEGGDTHDIIAYNGKFYFFYMDYANRRPGLKMVTNAYEDLQDDAREVVPLVSYFDSPLSATYGASDFLSVSDMTAVISDEGIFYVYCRATASQNEGIVYRSITDGSSWEDMSKGVLTFGSGDFGAWWYGQDASSPDGEYPTNFSACFQKGRVVMVCNNASGGSSFDNYLTAIYLGGWSQITMPTHTNMAKTDVNQVTWASTWVPFDEPDNNGWTLAGVGTDTIQSTEATMQISTGTTTVLNYSRNPTGTTAQGMISRFVMKPTSSGSTTTNQCGAIFRLADGTKGFQVYICIRYGASVEFAVYDSTAGGAIGTQIGSTVVMSSYSDYVDFLVAMDGNTTTTGKFRLWYRKYSTDSDRQWIAGPSSTALTNTGATYPNNLISWGHFVSPGSGSVISKWKEFHYVTGAYTGDALGSNGVTNPTDLFGRSYSRNPVYVHNGLKISAVGGPTFTGDEWEVLCRYAYPIDNIYPTIAPSPRQTWRSTSTASDQYIAWELNPGGTKDTLLGNETVGIYLGNTNFRTATLQVLYSTSPTWFNVITLDACTTGLVSLPYTRQGASVRPSTNTGTRYFYINEMYGWMVELASGNFRRVVGNTEGVWSTRTGQNVKTCSIFIELLPGEDATLATNGNLNLIPNHMVGIRHFTTVEAYAMKMRLIIPTQTNVDGYFQIGTMVYGPLVTIGTQHSWGRTYEVEANVEVTTSPDGSRRSRVLGPPRKRVDIAWEEGIDMTQPMSSAPAPDYIKNSTVNGRVIGSVKDTPYQMMGVYVQNNGPHTPLVFLPYVQRATTDNQIYNYTNDDKALYCRMVTPISLEQVVGDDTEDDVFRIATVSLEEEI